MHLLLIGFIFYFATVSIIALVSYYTNKKNDSSSLYTQSIVGNRSINYIATAFSAHASDMSDWLFMAFPAALYSGGMINAWIGIGLVAGMWAVWKWVAPALRKATEEYNSITLSTYFERRFNDKTGILRIISACISLLFFAVYIAAGLKGCGFIAESIFAIPYIYGIIVGLACVIGYIYLGGYKTLAWVDCFQAAFLFAIIVYVPMVALWNIGGFTPLITAAKAHNIPLSIIPTTWIECINVIFMSLAWAVGYAGTPHILTKFMGIHNVDEMKKSQYIGLTWQVIVLTAAGLSGLLGLVYFAQPLQNKELVFIEIVKILFTDLQIGFILSAIAGAALSVVTAQALVLVSVLTEDLYKGTLRKNASEGELLWFYRCSIIIIACASFLVSYDKDTTIQSLVKYAWIGFGSSFSPLVLLALHSTYVNRYGAYASLITGGVIATLWNILLHHYIFVHYGLDIPAVIPGFILSLCLAYGISWATKRP